MYAVIKTGGKQYRVKAGDVLVVDKLAGDPGAAVAFDQVLMLGDGAPTVAGAVVQATLIETRKGEKIKVFKKIRRQGYRRTGGHRQLETVLRVTAVAGEGKTDAWDGVVDLTPRSVLNARARGLKLGPDAIQAEAVAAEVEAPVIEAAPEAEVAAKPAPKKRAAKPKAAPEASAAETPAAETPSTETDGEDA